MNETLNEVDGRIFSGFFEKASWNGEIGSDAAISIHTEEVIPEVRNYIKWMQPPLLRFPGGTAIDYYPWYNLIDSVPGFHATRPRNLHWRDPNATRDIVTSDGRMGLHEFIHLCREVGSEPHLVINLGDAFYGKRPIAEAAQVLAANFVRYCNATGGPMAELRAANGDPEPFNVKYWQIGNETWLFEDFHGEQRAPDKMKHYVNCVEAYVDAVLDAEPEAVLIVDGVKDLGESLYARVGDRVDYFTFHTYSPWGIREYRRHGEATDARSVSVAEVWRGLASAPKIDSVTGLSILDNWPLKNLHAPLAITEWNLNTWFMGESKQARPENELLAYGIGAGSYLNAILRVSDRVKIANQSMLVGTGWGITSIRVDTTEEERPVMYPTGMVTGLYARNHGDRRLGMTVNNALYYEQPLRMSGIAPSPRVAEQDVVVTATDEEYFLHVVSRAYAEDRLLTFRFPEDVRPGGRHVLLSDQGNDPRGEAAAITVHPLHGQGRERTLRVPARSVSVYRIPRATP